MGLVLKSAAQPCALVREEVPSLSNWTHCTCCDQLADELDPRHHFERPNRLNSVRLAVGTTITAPIQDSGDISNLSTSPSIPPNLSKAKQAAMIIPTNSPSF